MQIGVIGLGRMGANISRRLMRAGHSCVVWDANAATGAGPGQGGRAGRRLAAGGGAGADGHAARGLGDAAGRQDHRRDDRRSSAS